MRVVWALACLVWEWYDWTFACFKNLGSRLRIWLTSYVWYKVNCVVTTCSDCVEVMISLFLFIFQAYLVCIFFLLIPIQLMPLLHLLVDQWVMFAFLFFQQYNSILVHPKHTKTDKLYFTILTCRCHKHTEKLCFELKINHPHAIAQTPCVYIYKKVQICITECVLMKGFK